MTQSILEESPRNGVVVLTFNRPERRNALSIDMMRSMIQRLEQLSETRQARVVILRGAGPVFCAGMDLAEASNPDLVAESAECIAKTLSTLRYSPLVTIAAVHGGAYNLQIAFPEARRGLLPALITDVLQTKVREGDLAELFLVGNPIDAQRALQIGLLQRLTAPDKVLDVALELAKGVLAGGPQTIIDTKTLLHRAFDAAKPADHHDHSSIQEHLKARNSSEAREGLQAFLEKRPPNWIDP
jgi:methylglutaconyl-CoA hydratase